MYQVKNKQYFGSYGLDTVMIAAVAAVVLSSSCFFDTKYTLCETGQVCPSGWSCTAAQDGCHRDGCGDGIPQAPEKCDDGNKVNGDGCDNNCRLTECGNGIQTAVEECDDGNTFTEECPFEHDGLCQICDSQCKIMMREPARCGDGIVQIQEICDDGSLLCGTCSQDCKTLMLAYAMGWITVVGAADIRDIDLTDNILDHDTFTLNDGFNPAVTFEFDKTGDGVMTGNRTISVGGDSTAEMVASLVVQEINAVENLLIKAYAQGVVVTLLHTQSTSIGNQTITKTVKNVSFMVVGMNGGEGADCYGGDRCRVDADCRSNACLIDNTCGCKVDADCKSMQCVGARSNRPGVCQ